MTASTRKVSGPSLWPYPRWVAHRGAGKLAPENTLAAFKLGASHGWRMFECDAKLSADGVAFLMHDTTLDRTTNVAECHPLGTSRIGGDHPWSVLAQLDAGSWHSRAYAGEPLPTLANVARYCRANHCALNIEIKPTPGLERKTGSAVAAEAQKLWAGADVPPLLTSFRPDALEAARQSAPLLPRGLLLDVLRTGWLEDATALQCSAVICNHALWDAETVRQAKDAGLRTLSYTVNDEWAAERLWELGTDAVITDRIDMFVPAS
jgi:glycerophosphoryl diester phosphodiesterase